MSVRAVLLDFDGVIADTENIHIVAWQQTLSRMGWLIPDEAAATVAELDDRAWLKGLFATKKIHDGDIDGWCRLKQELTTQLLAQSDVIYPGVIDLITRIRGTVRLGVVSTTWRENVEAVLGAAGIREAFEFVVAKEDVAEVKPDPECYTLAVSKLGMDANDVFVIEDSPAGIEAARAAGLQVVAVGHRRPEGEWHAGASKFLPHLRNPSECLAALML